MDDASDYSLEIFGVRQVLRARLNHNRGEFCRDGIAKSAIRGGFDKANPFIGRGGDGRYWHAAIAA